jgi:hypothetical protein
MFTNQTRAAPATRTTELADDIADRIAAACHPDELDALIGDAWVKHRDGRLTANDLETLQEAALARMNAFPEGGTDTRPKPRPAPSGAPRAACRRPSRPREKLFGDGRPVPLDREAKCRLIALVEGADAPDRAGQTLGRDHRKGPRRVRGAAGAFRGRRTICPKLHANASQWAVPAARGFFGKAATSLFSHATAPGVWCQAGPQSLT